MKREVSLLDMVGRLRSRKSFLTVATACVLTYMVVFTPQLFRTPSDIRTPRGRIEKNAVNIREIFGQGHQGKKLFATINNAPLLDVMDHAKFAGAKAWEELKITWNPAGAPPSQADYMSNATTHANFSTWHSNCPPSDRLSGDLLNASRMVFFPLPCGLVFGSSITLYGRPRVAQVKFNPLTGKEGEVSQFFVEVQGFKLDENEKHPPTLLHLNPRLRGDWSSKPVIEHNSRYGKDEWGEAHRCDGTPDDEEVDEYVSCEKWLQIEDDQKLSNMLAKKHWWLAGGVEKEKPEPEYPLVEGRDFSLAIKAGVEGFHVFIDADHISSFPYRTGYSLEEATGILVGGDVDVDFSIMTALPQDDTWRALPVPNEEIELFVGIMSSTNHFAERMAIRKTWFQSKSIQSSQVLARFFVALNGSNDINLELKKEADYYGDIIILPFIDKYDIVVLKTVEICKFGVYNITAKYIMKCDDDTFVRIDSILEEVQEKAILQGLYMGNMNEGHWPLRSGKWAVTVEEWSDDQTYPTYANGPGYILSKDIVHFIVEENEKHKLQLFKMEDVSVGLWIGKFAKEKYLVEYVDIKRFVQNHCEENYLCTHYQSPRQMMCLWDKLRATNEGKCC